MNRKRQTEARSRDNPAPAATGFLSALTGLLDKLNELAETGTELRRSGTIQGAGGRTKGIYGFTIKTGLGNEPMRVERFGNIRPDDTTGQPVVDEVREPAIDLFEEKDHLLVVAEMPGISASDVKLEVRDDVLVLTASRGEKRYCKELLLPGAYRRSKMEWACNNGVLEIRCMK